MRSINKVILIGNVTRDPQTKTSSNGQVITTFGIATNRQWTTVNSDKRTSTEFHELVAWARLAEVCNKMIKKGMPIYAEGYLKTRSWESETGERFRKTEVVIQDIIILEKPKRNESHVDDITEDDQLEVETETKSAELKTSAPAKAVPLNDEPAAELPSDLKEIDIDDDLGL